MENLGPTSNPCNSGKLDHLNNSEMKYLLKYLAKGPGQPAVTPDLPAEDNIPSRLDYGLLSEYKRIRVCNVKKRDQLFLEIFGFKLDNEEQVTQTVHNFGCQLQNDMYNSGVKQPQEPKHRISTICAAEM